METHKILEQHKPYLTAKNHCIRVQIKIPRHTSLKLINKTKNNCLLKPPVGQRSMKCEKTCKISFVYSPNVFIALPT